MSCADSTDYLHLAGKAGHEASKGAVTYYNASFVDVSYSICSFQYFFGILDWHWDNSNSKYPPFKSILMMISVWTDHSTKQYSMACVKIYHETLLGPVYTGALGYCVYRKSSSDDTVV